MESSISDPAEDIQKNTEWFKAKSFQNPYLLVYTQHNSQSENLPPIFHA